MNGVTEVAAARGLDGTASVGEKSSFQSKGEGRRRRAAAKCESRFESAGRSIGGFDGCEWMEMDLDGEWHSTGDSTAEIVQEGPLQ